MSLLCLTVLIEWLDDAFDFFYACLVGNVCMFLLCLTVRIEWLDDAFDLLCLFGRQRLYVFALNNCTD